MRHPNYKGLSSRRRQSAPSLGLSLREGLNEAMLCVSRQSIRKGQRRLTSAATPHCGSTFPKVSLDIIFAVYDRSEGLNRSRAFAEQFERGNI